MASSKDLARQARLDASADARQAEELALATAKAMENDKSRQTLVIAAKASHAWIKAEARAAHALYRELSIDINTPEEAANAKRAEEQLVLALGGLRRSMMSLLAAGIEP